MDRVIIGSIVGLLPTRCHNVNTLRQRQNYRDFADGILKCISLNEHVWISLKISLKCVFKVRIDNIPALVWIWLGAAQATSTYLNQYWTDCVSDAYMHHSALLLNCVELLSTRLLRTNGKDFSMKIQRVFVNKSNHQNVFSKLLVILFRPKYFNAILQTPDVTYVTRMPTVI